MEAASDVAALPEPISIAAADQAAHEAPAAAARLAPDARPRVVEAWVGRASICWLSCCLPLLVTPTSVTTVVRLAVPAAAVWFVATVLAEESSRERRVAFGALARVAWLALAGFAALTMLSAWAPAAVPSMRTLIACGVVLALVAATWEVLLQRAQTGRMQLLVVGGSPAALALLDTLSRSRTPYRAAGIVCDEPLRSSLIGVPVLGRIDELPRVVRATRPDLLVVACEHDRPRVFEGIVAAADPQLTVAGLAELHEHLFGRLPIRQLSAAWFVSALHLYRRPYGRATKRLFDVVVAAIGLVLTAPVLAGVALLLACSGGPVIYRQRRQGQSGAPFTILKFRTMVPDSELPGTPVWATERDPRVTRIGRLLRSTRIDELPQLWNVLTGSMSIVGPRPERPEYFELLSANVPFWSGRTLLKPGITGWAQVNDGYAADCESAETKLSYDLWYLRHRSLLVDIAICARTFARLTAGAR